MHLSGQRRELLGIQALEAVAQRRRGVGMHLDDEPARARGERGQPERGHQGAHSRGVARVHHYRQMGSLPYQRHGIQVERVPGGPLEGANATLA